VLPAASSDLREEPATSVVAIVPARNEVEVLAETLPSLLQQDVSSMRVVLVDDGSTDGTARLADCLANELGLGHKLEVVAASPRTAGWSGKVHAQLCGCSFVLEQALAKGTEPPEWWLLTDADIRHRPGSVRSLLCQAVAQVDSGCSDLVSIMARLRAESFWERMIIPAFVFFFQLLYPFRRVARRSSRVAAAAGGCVLVRRSALEEAGGFAAIGGEIIDDVALGRTIKRAGGGVWLGFDPGIASVRSYTRLGDLWAMVSRTAFTQLRHRWDLLLLTLLALGCFLVSPPVVLAVALAQAKAPQPEDPGSLMRAGVWAILTWGLMVVAYMPTIRHHRIPTLYAVMLPVSGLLFGLMTAGSAFDDLRGKGPSWRGRSYESSRGVGSPPSR